MKIMISQTISQIIFLLLLQVITYILIVKGTCNVAFAWYLRDVILGSVSSLNGLRYETMVENYYQQR